MGVGGQGVLDERALVGHAAQLIECCEFGHRAGDQHLLDAILPGQVHQPQRLFHGYVTSIEVDVGVLRNQLQDFVQVRVRWFRERDADAAVEFLTLELGVKLAQGNELPVDLAALAGLVVRRVRAEADVLRAVAVVERGLDRAGVHAAVHGVHDEPAVGLEARYRPVDQPRGAVAHLEHVHVHYGAHARVPRLDGRLDRIDAVAGWRRYADQRGHECRSRPATVRGVSS